jgi:hypothetical protein
VIEKRFSKYFLKISCSMDSKKYFRFYISVFLFLTLVSCREKKVDHIGPATCPSSRFEYVQQPTVNGNAFNLSTDTVKLAALFNEDVPWTIIIKGIASKSFKKYSGYGRSIDLKWIGNPDTTVFFQVEQCTVEFKVACIESIVKTFTITAVNKFSYFSYLVFNGDGGALGTIYGPPYGYPQTLAPIAVTSMISNLNSPQGGNCLCTHGVSNSPTFFFGGFTLNAPNLSTHVLTEPEKVYFNCFVNVKGSLASIPVVSFLEGTIKRNKNILVYGEGWHYVSFPLSEANIVNPQNIASVDFGLNGYPDRTTSGDMCVDFVSFTNNSPFITTGDKIAP